MSINDLNKLAKPYFLIHPDYEGCLGYFSKDNCSYGCDADIVELEDYKDTPFKIPGIENWCYEWHFETITHKGDEPTDFDWEDWHKRGLAFAQLLRQLAPDEIEIVYRRGLENILLEKITRFTFCPDITWVIADTNLYVIIAEDDEFDVGYFPPIRIPGLSKWWLDFDCRVDYADTTADPTYDWASWTARGWELVKQIRAVLHESICVEYLNPFELRDIFPLKKLRVNLDGSFSIIKE